MGSCMLVTLAAVLGNVKTKMRSHVLKHDLQRELIFLLDTAKTFRKVKILHNFPGRLQ